MDDGNLTDKQTLIVSVANLQDSREITSYGGLDTAILQVSNQKMVAVIHFWMKMV